LRDDDDSSFEFCEEECCRLSLPGTDGKTLCKYKTKVVKDDDDDDENSKNSS
jgi:hypothetical protein